MGGKHFMNDVLLIGMHPTVNNEEDGMAYINLFSLVRKQGYVPISSPKKTMHVLHNRILELNPKSKPVVLLVTWSSELYDRMQTIYTEYPVHLPYKLKILNLGNFFFNARLAYTLEDAYRVVTDCEPPKGVDGSGLVPSTPDMNKAIMARYLISYIAKKHPNLITGANLLDIKEGEEYVCTYSLTTPVPRQVSQVTGSNMFQRLINKDEESKLK